jgi:predicted amidophosphoribosyltransferase
MFKRIKSTPSQQGLNREQRVRNLRHAFALNNHPNHTHIAIIDDVVTTGSSVRQLCNLLFDVGVEKIDIYCICRTEV